MFRVLLRNPSRPTYILKFCSYCYFLQRNKKPVIEKYPTEIRDNDYVLVSNSENILNKDTLNKDIKHFEYSTLKI